MKSKKVIGLDFIKNISTKTYTKSFAISKEDQDNLIGMTPINTIQNSLEIPSIPSI